MTAVFICWIAGSFLLAPVIGRAMRARPIPRKAPAGARAVA